MKIVKPNFYDRFRCLAGECPDSCCHEWEVDVDADAAARYLALEAPLGDRLREVLKASTDGYSMSIQNRRCPMWRRDGLCEIQAQLGHDALCETCREFPRLRHDYGDYVELGLELSCPEAARLLFAPYGFVEESLPGGEPECDPRLFSLLLDSRKQALEFLETAPLPVGEKLAVLLLYAYDVQAALDGDALLPLDASLLESAQKYATGGDISGFYPFFESLEILTPRWKKQLHRAPTAKKCREELGYLMKYLICRYWLQAVADGELTVWVKFMIIACLLINALGGDLIATAQLFSKEIENDPDNLEAILDAVYCETPFTDGNLLGLLLNTQHL